MFGFSRKTTALQTRRFRPEVQALEDRQLLAGGVTVSIAADVVTIHGTKGADQVDVTSDGAGFISVNASGLGGFHQSGVRKLVIDTKGGRDTVTFTQIFSQIRD